jgi:hypothetical protein
MVFLPTDDILKAEAFEVKANFSLKVPAIFHSRDRNEHAAARVSGIVSGWLSTRQSQRPVASKGGRWRSVLRQDPLVKGLALFDRLPSITR